MYEAIARALKEKRNLLEPEALKLFTDFGLPVPQYKFARTLEEAVAASAEIGYPVVLKIVSAGIIHKADVGGVKVHLESDRAVEAAFVEIRKNAEQKAPGAAVEGILVSRHIGSGLECIVGMTRDPQFGPAIMYGLGGIFVEVLKDVSFRILPLTGVDAESMIKETKSYQLLQGIRGEKPKDMPALIDFLLKTSALIEQNPEIRELDINPIAILEKGVLALDARVLL